ncbi:sulfatase-like hydrolase/transferase [Puniceicoccales bacterium CK1056]|uniref:Sulfatase-like hydrolase/transferase n=1 Tax=Oceanipulchritudo coccoides TaxID=2706888 RepID=A0A6B2M3E4_9BACT|nr:sulfatase-like hydrolase/transferase [Oceanipulchritudo coccoides]NDV62832.1 sulfatase-like hydrolase/transferase [Oceanipulchritudo coccoides]
MKTPLILICTCLLLTSLMGESRQPNVVVVLMDDYGLGQFAPVARQLELENVDPGLLAFTETLGDAAYDPQVALEASRRAMPFMDSLSENGLVFTRAFSASNLCSPARQGLVTGINPIRFGGYRNIDVNELGLPEGKSLVGLFKGSGYRTGMIGKWHLGRHVESLREKVLAAGGSYQDVLESGYMGSAREQDHPLNHGFDYAYFYNLWECPFYGSRLIWEDREFTGKQNQYNTDLFTDKAIAFMKGSLDAGEPFMVELALHTAHKPLDVDAPETYASRFDTGSALVDRFYSHIYAVDRSIQRISEMLKGRGEWENTILFFTADNGATCNVGDGDLSLIPGNGPHRGHKGQMFLGGIRVPMLMVWPDKIKGAHHVTQAVSVMDVLPTALDAIGVPVPGDIDGTSLLPLLKDLKTPLHERLYFTGIHAAAWGYSSHDVIGNAEQRRDLSPGSWVIVEGDWVLRYVGKLVPGLMRSLPDGEDAAYGLFNIKDDPLEQNNLYEEFPDIAARLTKAYMEFAKDLPPPPVWDRARWEELVMPAESGL